MSIISELAVFDCLYLYAFFNSCFFQFIGSYGDWLLLVMGSQFFLFIININIIIIIIIIITL